MLIKKIEEKALCGRSGSQFPVYLKWSSFKSATGDKKYLICNVAEGEPGAKKDRYLIENELEKVLDGIDITLKEFSIAKAFFYLKPDYYNQYKEKVEKALKGKNIEIKIKEDKYIAGEETSAINSIEGKRAEPYEKPPYPTEKGLWGRPTLIHNIETFYAISEIAKDEYKNERFFSIIGDIKNEGVFKLKESLKIEEILKETNNYPDFDFVCQVGGGASGIFFTKDDLDRSCNMLGSIKVFKKETFNPEKELKRITSFLMHGNCNKCTPCREGIYRINQIKENVFQDSIFEEINFSLKESSYCPLGKAASDVFESLKKIYES